MHRQHFSGFFRFAIGTFSPHPTTLGEIETPMMELAMETIANLYLSLPREWKWPKVNTSGPARPFGDALELYRSALSAAYVTAVFLDQQNECRPDDHPDGRDPRW
jgi:hypothetical protein